MGVDHDKGTELVVHLFRIEKEKTFCLVGLILGAVSSVLIGSEFQQMANYKQKFA